MVIADVEETVAFETERLMNLEIETNGFHIECYVYCLLSTLL